MQLRIPGPTPLPDAVREVGAMQMVNHRGAEFRAVMQDVTEKLQGFFQTSGDVLVFPAAGTGGLEAAIVNMFSPGDTVLSVTIGHFGDRFADIAEAYGLRVLRLEGEWGKAADPAPTKQALAEHPEIKGVMLTHNETSTGVQNDVAAFGELTRDTDKLLIVDSVSGLGGADLQIDNWGVDVAITASQKGWMTPPGLAMISVNKKAWAANAVATLPRYYWSFAAARKYLAKWETPYTPAVSLLFQMQAALQLMSEEGLQNIFKRHEQLRDYTRQRIKDMGLQLYAADAVASRTITSIRTDDSKAIVKALNGYGVEVAGGQGPLDGKIIRIAHLGFASQEDMQATMDALAAVVQREPALAH